MDTIKNNEQLHFAIVDNENIGTAGIVNILRDGSDAEINIANFHNLNANAFIKAKTNFIIIRIRYLEKAFLNRLKQLRTKKFIKNIPIIIITEHNHEHCYDIDSVLYPIDILQYPINKGLLLCKINLLFKLYFNEKKMDYINIELKQIKQELKNQNKQLRYYALHDVLTAIPNRYFFEKTTLQLIKISKRYQRNFVAMLLDIDNFKWINDKFGHGTGDEVLKFVAEKLKTSLRESDIISRYGGDEFAIILSELKSEMGASLVAQKILRFFSNPIKIKEKSIQISISIGITYFYHQKNKGFDMLMEEADIAMYNAKRNGKNRFEFFSEELQKQYNYQNVLNYELHKALKRNEFSIHYQPIVNINNNKITGAEALLRWNNAKLGNIAPLKFIPVAEETDEIYDIGLWIIETVCDQLSKWKKMNLNKIYISINISPKQIKNLNFGLELNNIAKKYNITPEEIELEITETAFLSDNGDSMEKYVNFLQGFKTTLAIDDFGAKYSSLSRLGKIPLKTLKIDGSLLNTINIYPRNKIILNNIFKMAKALSLKVVSEKVETNEELAFLKENKCCFAQGFYFSKPVDADTMTKLLIAESNKYSPCI